MKSQRAQKQTKARPNKKTAESAENISAMKRNRSIHNDFPAISSQSLQFVCPRNARVISAKELGTMSKNNLRWMVPVFRFFEYVDFERKEQKINPIS